MRKFKKLKRHLLKQFEALYEVIGAYAIAVTEEGNEDEIIVAKKGSPLVVGIAENEFLASDATPLLNTLRMSYT